MSKSDFYITVLVVSQAYKDAIDFKICPDTGDVIRLHTGKIDNRIPVKPRDKLTPDQYVVALTFMTLNIALPEILKQPSLLIIQSRQFELSIQISVDENVAIDKIASDEIKYMARTLEGIFNVLQLNGLSQDKELQLTHCGVNFDIKINKKQSDQDYQPGIDKLKAMFKDDCPAAWVRRMCEQKGWKLEEFTINDGKDRFFVQALTF